MSISYDLSCDYCGTIINAGGRSAAQTRRDAKDQALVFRHGRNEYCKHCIEGIRAHATVTSQERA